MGDHGPVFWRAVFVISIFREYLGQTQNLRIASSWRQLTASDTNALATSIQKYCDCKGQYPCAFVSWSTDRAPRRIALTRLDQPTASPIARFAIRVRVRIERLPWRCADGRSCDGCRLAVRVDTARNHPPCQHVGGRVPQAERHRPNVLPEPAVAAGARPASLPFCEERGV